MKKGLIFVLGILSFLGINTVSAETVEYHTYIDSSEIEMLLNNSETITLLENKFSDEINNVLKKYDYYSARIGISGDNEPYLVIYAYNTNFTTYSSFSSYVCDNEYKAYSYYLKPDNSFEDKTDTLFGCSTYSPLPFSSGNGFNPQNFYFSNLNLTYDYSDTVNFYIKENLYLTLNSGDTFPPYKDASTFIPEITCESWDFSCKFDNDIDNVSDVFEAPMEFLESIWTSISSIFEVIFEFFALLPKPMQGVLYVSFMIAIFIGIIKLIL